MGAAVFTRAALLALGLSLLAGGASAQGYFKPRAGPAAEPCVLDKCLNGAQAPAQAPAQAQPTAPQPGAAPPAPDAAAPQTAAPSYVPRQQQSSRGQGSGAPGDFDFYVFTLSWSSGFCALQGAGRGKSQCADGAGLGFVVHGLWPQYERGFPSDCGADRAPSRAALDSVRGVFPDEGLARYEWRKHGTCSGKAPEAYFSDVRAMFQSVVVPDAFKSPRREQSFSPMDISRAFIAANPGLRLDAMAIGCQRQVLQEVRFCVTKDLRQFRSCPEVARGTCRSTQISVPPVL